MSRAPESLTERRFTWGWTTRAMLIGGAVGLVIGFLLVRGYLGG